MAQIHPSDVARKLENFNILSKEESARLLEVKARGCNQDHNEMLLNILKTKAHSLNVWEKLLEVLQDDNENAKFIDFIQYEIRSSGKIC